MDRLKKQSIPDFSAGLKLKTIIYRVIFYLFLVFFILAAGYIFLFSKLTQISRIEVVGTTDLDPEAIKDLVTRLIGGKYLGILPRKNFMVIRSVVIERSLKDEFRKINSVDSKKIFPDSLWLEINERQALIIWCSGGPCFIIDENGLAYSGIDLDSKDAKENNLIKLVDESAREVDLGEKFLDSNCLKYVLGIREVLRNKSGIEIQDEFFTRSRVSEEFKVKTSGGWNIYFSSGFPAEGPVEMMKIFLDQKIPPEEIPNLEYVDLRVEGKVYYKMKNVPSLEEEKTEERAEKETGSEDADKEKKKKDKE